MILQGTKIIVVGAGIAGLAVARFLGLAGAQVHVIEQSPALRTAGAGIQISPNGARVLRALGLEPALKALGLRAQAVMLQDGFTGQMVSRATLGEDFYFLHRSDLLGLLADGARNAGVLIEFGQKLAAYDLTGSCPKIINANGQVNSASLIIGADGLHSGLRAQLNGASAPLYTGYVAWRALCDIQPIAKAYPLRRSSWRPSAIWSAIRCARGGCAIWWGSQRGLVSLKKGGICAKTLQIFARLLAILLRKCRLG